jgi:dTMP kinase
VREPDKFEQLNTSFFESVRQEYLRRASEDPCRFRLIDASQSKEQIWNLLQEISLSI